MVKVRAVLARVSLPAALAVAVTLVGLFLRVEHALTFDGPHRGSDFNVYVAGVRWTLEHKRAFFFDPSVNYQVRYQPPLWFATSAVILYLTHSERAIAGLAVAGWLVRQFLLAKMCTRSSGFGWSACLALSLHAVLPLGVLIDGKVNPEGLHSTLFTLGVFLLWRMERQVGRGLSFRTALAFGLVAGCALLTKATSAVLLIAAPIVLAFHVLRTMRLASWPVAVQRLIRPALLSGLVALLVAGWWVTPNLLKYRHPFPHAWDLEGPETHAILAQPMTYRRPLGWALPFDWAPYREFPVLRTPDDPRPNFWSNIVTGTWTDLYNRGFCRLAGPGTDYVWGGTRGFMAQGPDWAVSDRCIALFQKILPVGMGLSLAVALAAVQVAWLHLRTGSRGSLALPLSAGLGTCFLMLLALKYPFDHMAVLNPRYLMPVSTPLIACFGIALGELPANGWRKLAHAAAFLAILAVALFLFVERFGK